jgi:hypothetical protein
MGRQEILFNPVTEEDDGAKLPIHICLTWIRMDSRFLVTRISDLFRP